MDFLCNVGLNMLKRESKRFNKLSNVRSAINDLLVINGIFIIEVLFLRVFFFTNATSKFEKNVIIIFALVFVLINSITFKKSIRLILKRIQYLLLTEIISYFFVYTVALIIISSGISWSIDRFGIFILSLILDLIVLMWAYHFTENNKISLMVLILSIISILLLFSLAISIDISNLLKCNILYLICSSVTLGSFSVIFFKKKSNINNYLIKFVHYQVVDISISFFVIVVFLLFIAAAIVEISNKSALRNLFDNWAPILTISIAMGCVWGLYSKKIKKSMDKLYRYYFIFWTVVPPILFIFYLNKLSFGNYTTFKALLGIIAVIDAMVLLAFGDSMKALVPKFKNKKVLIPRANAEYNIIEIKLVLSNITILSTFLTTIFPDETTVTNWINGVSNFCCKIGNLLKKYLGENNLETIFSKNMFDDSQFKMIIFMFIVVGLLLLLSWAFFKMEKWLFLKISFKQI